MLKGFYFETEMFFFSRFHPDGLSVTELWYIICSVPLSSVPKYGQIALAISENFILFFLYFWQAGLLSGSEHVLYVILVDSRWNKFFSDNEWEQCWPPRRVTTTFSRVLTVWLVPKNILFCIIPMKNCLQSRLQWTRQEHLESNNLVYHISFPKKGKCSSPSIKHCRKTLCFKSLYQQGSPA